MRIINLILLLLIVFLFSCGKGLKLADETTSTSYLPFAVQFGSVTASGDATAFDQASGYHIDNDGNSYNTGFTWGSLFEANISGAFQGDVFVTKTNINGQVEWSTQLGNVTVGANSNQSDICNDISTDSNGNVYCVGSTTGNLGEANAGSGDAFVVKLNKNGALQWTTQLGATSAPGNASGDDTCHTIHIDENDNIFCGGSTTGALGEANAGSNDAFILKLNTSGAIQWLTHFGATTGTGARNNAERCWGVATDSSGSVYCTGPTTSSFGDTIDGSGNRDTFLLKVNSSGVFQWVTQLGTTNAPGSSTAKDDGNDLLVDSNDNIFVLIATEGSLNEANGGSQDIAIAKFDTSGSLTWVKQFGNVTSPVRSSGDDECYSLAEDLESNIVCIGSTTGSFAETNGGGADILIISIDQDGNEVKSLQYGAVTKFENTDQNDYCYAGGFDKHGNFYCGGTTYSDFGEARGGSGDIFTIRASF
mgnify:CR=1 FL=1